MTSSDEISTSDITLTPGTDGASDYRQDLEKTNQKDSRRDASLGHSSPNEDGEIQRHNSSMNSPAPTLDKEIQLGVPAVPMLGGSRHAHAGKESKKRPHRFEAARDSHEYPGSLALALLTVGICLSVFLVSLDRTIVATVRSSCDTLGTRCSELNSFTSRPSRASPTISTLLTTLVGTAART